MAIILGMNIRQAACQGMIDNTILAAYTDSLQPSTAPKASAKDETLFVSDDENEISTPQLQINGVTLEYIDSDDALSIYSDGSNNSEPASQDRPLTDDGEDETRITEPLKSQPSELRETFSSLFGTSMQLPSASTSSQIPSSPFAFLSAPAGSSPVNGQLLPNTNAPPSVNRDEEPSSFLSTNASVFPPPQTDKAPSTAVSGQIEPAESSVLDLKPTRPFSIAAAISNATPPMSNSEDVKSVGIFDKMRMGTNPQNPPIISFNTPSPMQSTEQKPNHAPNFTPKLKEASQPIANSANGVSTQLSGSSLLAESPLMPKWPHSSTKETGNVASGPVQSNFPLGDNPLISTGHALQKSLGSVKGTQVQTSADEFSSPASYFSTESKESLLDKRELMGEGLISKCLSSFYFFITVIPIFHFVPLSSNRRLVPVTTLN